MLHPKEMEILNKMLQAGKPVGCLEIADGEELLLNTVRSFMRGLQERGYVIVDGQGFRGRSPYNLYSVTEKARKVATEQTVNSILKLRYLIEPTQVVSQLVGKMDI